MFRRIYCLTFLLILVPILANGKTNLGLRLGMGLVHYNTGLYEYNPKRALLGFELNGVVAKGKDLALRLDEDLESSLLWFHVGSYMEWIPGLQMSYRMPGFDYTGYRILLDFQPRLQGFPGRMITPSVGLGGTAGWEYRRLKDAYYGTSKNHSYYYGFILNPDVSVNLNAVMVNLSVLYRYLFSNIHQDGYVFYDHRSQVLRVAVSTEKSIWSRNLQVGLQAENWIERLDYSDSWPPWPKEWEYLLFVGMTI